VTEETARTVIPELERELARRLGMRPSEDDIARALKCTRDTLRRWRKAFGVPRSLIIHEDSGSSQKRREAARDDLSTVAVPASRRYA
jgi:DNA-directed RNA polymerase specialized sigma subunit